MFSFIRQIITSTQEAHTMAPRTQSREVEVPVKRHMEYVPASFTSMDDEDTNTLNDSEARWFSGGDDSLILQLPVSGEDEGHEFLVFNVPCLQALIAKHADLDPVDAEELIDLVT